MIGNLAKLQLDGVQSSPVEHQERFGLLGVKNNIDLVVFLNVIRNECSLEMIYVSICLGKKNL